MSLKNSSALELLGLYNAIEAELKTRGVVRTKNNPVGDYAEYLFCKVFDWQQADNSQKAIDAIDAQGVTYQIKARRRSEDRDNRQLGAIRDLKEGSFDYLAGLVFNPDYTIFKAALIPVKMVVDLSTYSPHTNSWKFFLKDKIWNYPEVVDVTKALMEQENKV